MAESSGTRVLVAGWFSFEPLGATAGDVQARDLACSWLERAGVAYDVANAPALASGLDWRAANPDDYSHVVFVCGPAGRRPPLPELVERFARCRLVGLDVSMDVPLAEWNPFEVLLERDSERGARPDLAFGAPAPVVPVIGVVLVPLQREYGERARHADAEVAIARLTTGRPCVAVAIDTALTNDPDGRDPSAIRSPDEAEALIARMDAVLTTRLHGLVLALKAGVPVVALDPVAGGAKVSRQAEAVGWPLVFTPEQLDPERLDTALDHCLTEAARGEAAACAQDAARSVEAIRRDFLRAVQASA